MADPANYPLLIVIGDTKTVSLTMQDGDGAAIDITGRTYSAQIRTNVDDASPLATFSCSIISAAAGTMKAVLSATTTAALSPGDAVWSLVETSSGIVTTILRGDVQIVESVTR